MVDRADSAITRCIDALRAAGATGIEQYEQKLRTNMKHPVVLCNMLFEGRAALMFLQHGFKVALQERPDLRIQLDEQVLYVEVTHFLEKEQDRLDDKRMSDTDLLVEYGDTVELEGAPAQDQLANVAKRKAGQYVPCFSNILVVESSSPSLELLLGSAVDKYDRLVRTSDDPRLSRLSGIMLINQTDWTPMRDQSKVEFCQTARPSVPLSREVATALHSMCLG